MIQLFPSETLDRGIIYYDYYYYYLQRFEDMYNLDTWF